MGIRRALLIVLAVPALVAGLLAMHTLGGSGHGGGHGLPVAAVGHRTDAAGPAHRAGAEAAEASGHLTHAASTARLVPFAAEASGHPIVGSGAPAAAPAAVPAAVPMGGHGAAAALACVLALLATLLLVAAADPLRTLAPRAVAVLRTVPMPSARRPRVLSLAELSISRT
ncbi:hypothetical protein ACWKWP_05530 [Agromyces soli]